MEFGIEGAPLGFLCDSSVGITIGTFDLAFSRGVGWLGVLVCCGSVSGSDSVKSTTPDCTFLLLVGIVPTETLGRFGAGSEGSGRLVTWGWRSSYGDGRYSAGVRLMPRRSLSERKDCEPEGREEAGVGVKLGVAVGIDVVCFWELCECECCSCCELIRFDEGDV